MKQSTSFAQVANNFLTVLQGYSKTIRLLLVMFLTLTVTTNALGALSSPYTCTFTTNLTLSNNQVKTGDVTWTLSTTTGKGTPATAFGNTNGQSAIKLGSGKNNYYSKMTLTTSAFSTYNVSKVVLYISSNNGGSKTIRVKQGNTQIGTGSQNFSSTTWVTNCTRNTTKGSGGDLSIEISSDATATFIHSISVTYETAASYTVTYKANGGSGTMSNSTGSSIKIKECTFTAPECKQFTSWNTATNGSGTSYAPNATVTTNLTLYAQWEDLPSYTVKLMDNNEVLTSSCNTPIALPSRVDCDGYTFAGWTQTWTEEQEEWTTTAPAIIPAGSYIPIATENLYPVYTKTVTTESDGKEETKSVTLSTPTTTTSGYKEGTKTDSEGNTWSYYAAINNQSGTYEFGLNSNSNNYNIGSPIFDGKVNSVSFKARNGSSSEARKFLFCSTNTIAQPTKGDLAEVSIPKSQQFTNIYTADLSQSNISQFYIYAPKALGITAITVTYTTSIVGATTTTTSYISVPECNTEPSR